MAIIRKLDEAFTGVGASAPKLTKIDKIESAGSLFLLDMSHPYESILNGYNVNGGTIKNLFSSNLSTLAGTSSGLDTLIAYSISSGSTSRVVFERTGKQGIHVGVQQKSGTEVYDRYSVQYPAALVTYMEAHKDHAYYVSLWQRTTRATTFVGGLAPNYQQLAQGGSGITLNFGTGSIIAGVTLLGSNYVSPSALSNHLFAAAVQTVNAAGLTNVSTPNTAAFIAGNFGSWNNSGAAASQDELPSQILYRTYVEDLTVSGRSYAEVFAIDNEMYLKEMSTAGGRYYNDTFTNPTSMTFPA